MTGVELLRHAKRIRPEATRLLFTGYADIKAVIDAINQGSVFRYITKPWDPDELQAVVRQAVEQHDLIVEKHRLLAELKETNAAARRGQPAQGGVHRGRQPRAEHARGRRPGDDRALEDDPGRGAPRPPSGPGSSGSTRPASGWPATVERMLKLIRTDELGHDARRSRSTSTALDPRRRSSRAAAVPRGAEPDGRPRARPRPRHGRGRPGQARRHPHEPARQRDQVHPRRRHDRAVAAAADGPDRVRFAVTDQGHGHRPGDRPHLFEPFFTGFDTMHHSSGDYQFGKRGIGLGLCLVKRSSSSTAAASTSSSARRGLDVRLHPPPARRRQRRRSVEPIGPRRQPAGTPHGGLPGLADCDVVAEVAEEGRQAGLVPGLLDRLLEPLVLGLERAEGGASGDLGSSASTWSWVLTESRKPCVLSRAGSGASCAGSAHCPAGGRRSASRSALLPTRSNGGGSAASSASAVGAPFQPAADGLGDRRRRDRRSPR